MLARPTITDQDYDRLYHELLDLETAFPDLVTPDSPSQRVGGAPVKEFKPVKHALPMLSLEKVRADMTPSEKAQRLARFVKSVQKEFPGQDLDWIVEPKIDGVAVSLRYEAGRLACGSTRGDGMTGDDITENLRTIRSIPVRLQEEQQAQTLFDPVTPQQFEVRGEAFLSEAGFAAFNAELVAAGEEPFKNPRNAAAGALKQLDSRTVARQPLEVILYDFFALAGGARLPRKHNEMLAWIKTLGFRTPDRTWFCRSLDEILAAIADLDEVRGGFSYETDGAVIKLNSLAQRDELPPTSNHPRWAIAYKYPPSQAQTKLISVTMQLGRTGTLTPVAELEPVLLAGSTISRATLHNEDYVRQKDIRVGDTVTIEKAGEIIPAVVEVVITQRPDTATVFRFPHICPECRSDISRTPEVADGDERVAYRCLNPDCPAQVRRRLEHWCARGAMDVEGGGEMLVRQLVDNGLVKSVADLYSLRLDKLTTLERMGEKSAQTFLDGIAASRNRDAWRLLFALGILHVGPGVAKKLCGRFHTLDEILDASVEQLKGDERDGIGEAVTTSIDEWRQKEQNIRLINGLREQGLNFKSELHQTSSVSGPLTGKTFVFTGELPNLGRREASSRVESAGGKVSSSVSKKTDFVVAGADPSGSKIDKARVLGLRIIDEKELLHLCGE